VIHKNISFQYDEKSPFILDNINLIIKHNAITFIKGESGSGKTTLVDLLLGLHLPTKGVIEVDTVNIGHIVGITERSREQRIEYCGKSKIVGTYL
jgi:ABC-type bacteriocin/lantibiotic exporter with double-glycine peptidase domain